jgi:hypothetical protein
MSKGNGLDDSVRGLPVLIYCPNTIAKTGEGVFDALASESGGLTPDKRFRCKRFGQLFYAHGSKPEKATFRYK